MNNTKQAGVDSVLQVMGRLESRQLGFLFLGSWGRFSFHPGFLGSAWTERAFWMKSKTSSKYSRVGWEAFCLTAEITIAPASLQQQKLKKKRLVALEWPCQSLDFSLIEILLWDLKRVGYKWRSANLNELRQRWKEEWFLLYATWKSLYFLLITFCLHHCIIFYIFFFCDSKWGIH